MDMSEIKLTQGLRALRGEMRMHESMKKYTSWRAGGEAERIYIPADLADLAQFIRGLPEDEPVHMVGLGSNLLVRDGGVRGTVVVLHARLNDLRLVQQDKNGGLIAAGAGVACAKVARFAAVHNLSGAEFLAGIPGTVGGALAMNAGCYGAETWGIVEQVRILSRTGELRARAPADYEIGYRHVALKPEMVIEDPKMGNSSGEEWFVGGGFRLASGEDAASRKKIKELLSRRITTQPLNLPNAGSVFRNPPGDHAARLIEFCGLKGLRRGGAMVSAKHANFIVNTGNATAEEIEMVILAVRKAVKEQTGIELVQEVRIIGLPRESGQIQNFPVDSLIRKDPS
ncbi:UDP-N-acetylmuramate dehydrogenase [Nitrosospira sp. NpAV]|uniref:UDP-N-acetylmuramate dehydrogenase n=1 Tax=Nitrosospira sp. NpAV TaxID=58133 RepID=UPI0005A29B8B|nr:UDP-N-acetylmuramate dehydrogenase [Nitrosospira sp. NpAV]KIO49359.1 UDP-N-acetylenolpyruvoylglucosamine reductase [Nitrosospira sp. NpAV]